MTLIAAFVWHPNEFRWPGYDWRCARLSWLAPRRARSRQKRAPAVWGGGEICNTVGPTRKIANILIWVYALVMAYPYRPGSHAEAFKGM